MRVDGLRFSEVAEITDTDTDFRLSCCLGICGLADADGDFFVTDFACVDCDGGLFVQLARAEVAHVVQFAYGGFEDLPGRRF